MILITGATGFLGRSIVPLLAQRGEALRCLVRDPVRARALLGDGIECVAGDVTQAPSVQAAAQGADKLVHLVAIIREGKGRGTFQTINVEGTRNVMEAARSAGVKRLVHLSANGAMNDPRLHYAHSKWLGEEAVRGCGIPFVILRPSLLFGPGDEFFSMVAAVVRAMPLVPIPGNGRARFQPIAMENAARCAVAALHDDRLLGQTIAIGGPEQMTMDQLYRLIAGVLRVRRLYAHVPVGLLRPAAAVLERLTPFAPVTPEQLVYATRDNIVELDAVQRHFGFTPKPMQGNLDYLQKITWRSAAKAMLGLGAPPTA